MDTHPSLDLTFTANDLRRARGGALRTGVRAGRVNETVTNLSRSQSDALKSTGSALR